MPGKLLNVDADAAVGMSVGSTGGSNSPDRNPAAVFVVEATLLGQPLGPCADQPQAGQNPFAKVDVGAILPDQAKLAWGIMAFKA